MSHPRTQALPRTAAKKTSSNAYHAPEMAVMVGLLGSLERARGTPPPWLSFGK